QAEQAQQQIRQDLHSCYPAGLQYDAELERIWDQDHDRHVIARLLEMVRREFSPGTWHAFRLNVLEGLSPKHAAEELSISVNAILIAKSRIMRRLRQLGEKMVEIPAIHQIGLDDPPESQEPRTLATRMERQ
ncbi:MAG: sigma-70 family RNA polymerase sigma factor, partial [Planctomycetaceae bacterium]|nr:sigma-70 family RNA polymerase sigma factor [Planctomycetaceae bacterium]